MCPECVRAFNVRATIERGNGFACLAVLEAVPSASDCHVLRPLGSIKAPRLVAYVGYDARNWTSASARAFAKATLAPKERTLE